MTSGHDIASTALMAEPEGKRLAQQRVTLGQRMGRISTAFLVGGTALILGCVAFLGFLWLSNETNTAWRNIVVSGWVTRSITIMAFALRAVTAGQAAVATSMVASLLLQKGQTKLHSTAAVSIARFTNAGPMALLPHLHKHVGWSIHSLLGTLYIVNIALQLTSTLLLSGVGRGTIVTDETIPSLNYGVTMRSLFSVPREPVGYLLHSKGPVGFPAFAELAEPAQADTGDGIRDTGPSLRAFLPITTQAKREATLGFEGMATMLDTRVVCVRPNMDNLRIFAPSRGHKLNGTIWTDRKMSGLFVAEAAPEAPLEFSCRYALVDKTRFSTDGSDVDPSLIDWDEEWAVRLCNLLPRNGLGRIRSGLRSPLLEDNLYPYLPPKLIVHTTGPPSTWEAAIGEINITRITGSDEWLVAETNIGASVRITLCNTDVIAQDTHITATRPSGSPEPVPLWNSDKFIYNITHILPQLGIIHQGASTAPRDIFTFSSHTRTPLNVSTSFDPITNITTTIPSQDETFPQHTYVTQALMDISDLFSENGEPQNLTLCFYCTHDGDAISFGQQVSPIPAAIFQGALQSTGGNAAVALQAVMTTALGMTYYDLTGRFDKGAEAKVRGLVEVDVPRNGTFAVVVVALLGVHLALVGVAVVWFAKGGEGDLIGASWAAVVGVRGEEVDGVLEEVRVERMRDGEVKRRMVETGQGACLVGIDEEGRLEVRKRIKKGVDAE
ncbi:hypothetical protein B0T14DRAFT_134929 [Immersiella caudata]|uniref:Uncharacterized protein n=1 Tax=Immersiella caudata TaxID=314043 RepID=A0AA40C6U6_9PEZI|nr:hypothetical protein B0T14DRAFT_134929 [Immersiella caudata]